MWMILKKKIKDKMLDNFEKEFEDARSFDSSE
jgi:hypothetical protein